MSGMAPMMTRTQSVAFDDLVGRLSHDLRSPVRAMVEVARWIAEDTQDQGLAENEILRDHIDLLQQRGERLQKLVSDLTAYDAVGASAERFDGDWPRLIQDVTKAVRGLGAKDFHWTAQGRPDIASKDLYRLLVTLLSNACKHHDRPDGHVFLTGSDGAGYYVLQVQDDGPGIDPQLAPKMFEPLSTLEGRDQVEGSGLGLSIAARIVRLYGGGAR